MRKRHSKSYLRIRSKRRFRRLKNRIPRIAIAAGAAAIIAATSFYCYAKRNVPETQYAEPGVITIVSGNVPSVAESAPTTAAETKPETEDDTEADIQPDTEPETESVPETETEPETEPATEQTEAPLYDEYEEYLLAKIAMAEAGTEDTEGKALVILTVLNRVRSEKFPNTISEVLYQYPQFTPVWDGTFDRIEPSTDCYAALELVKSGWDGSHGALYFEVTKPYATWHSEHLVKLFEHGVTSFYTEVNAQ